MFVLRNESVLARIEAYLRKCLAEGQLVEVRVRPYHEKRSLEQNACLWAILTDISEQVVWHGLRYSPEEWKDILTAGLRKEQRLAPGINGGLIALGTRTSKMSVSEMSELLEFVKWFAAEKGVKLAA